MDFVVVCGMLVYVVVDGCIISVGWGGGYGNWIVVGYGIYNGVSLVMIYNYLLWIVVYGGLVSCG